MRVPVVADFETFAQIFNSERSQYMGGPMSREECWYGFNPLSALWLLHGHGGWTVRRKGDATPLGFVILGLEPGDLTVELGFYFTKAGEGRSIAYEAASAMRDWAFETYNWPSLISFIDKDNTRSINLATRMGAALDPATTAQIDDDMLAYLHVNPKVAQ